VVQFKVVGSYLPVVAAEPPELFLPRVRPDEPANGHALIVSQRWDAFTLEDLECSLESVQWELKPAAEADLTRLQAKSGYHLHVTLPSELPEGPFMHWVRFTAAQPGDESAVQRLEMPLAGKVLRRIAVYGKGVDSSGILHLQTLTPGAKHEQRFLVRVHDREPALQVASIDASPAFLGVSLEPYGDGSKEDLYSLQITVPEDAAEGVYRGASAGRILVSFDHPRVRQLELGVDLIISPAGKLAIR
jgi:hypothetical protein